ncbi:MAG: ATP-dependent zinc metalloprotease FtsH [Defluviitoga tunisiensis]|uniref:ATP-dependent zinc metalloprotease FtsH n=1 Tax=Defluviitoga tunisiensis TaxID=1006576 RepID=A0A0C7NZL9_DEFTU|nr:ATP-dependent zinc metalloprotease FtsH [Defluviitoga tunisiensis]MDD3601307.1 ATP-dependent zinc metalloprotease FtsH [Defluviitoga tunisiensis]MDY0379993.1 ATP-dependent zinc metalloprotease FtsH [Defluviitoga tunisiensis]CEP77460.1 ATP-dependent metalloprotease FtsH [Defluviitoga tunisiensis]HHV00837.1 ATP-dependent zinc metalloprotease FtsH [Defluviitoga tunisiensis]HOB55102.1 ATP-dependent zinc metalloprotease FtsH [Defluviitoga tunisiensis]
MANNNQRTGSFLGPLLIYLFLGILIFVSISQLNRTNIIEINYTDLVNLINNDLIISIQIDISGLVQVKAKNGQLFQCYAPTLVFDQTFVRALANDGIKIEYTKSGAGSWWLTILVYALPTIILMFFWFSMLKKTTGGEGGIPGGNYRKSPARKYDAKKAKITFKDVAGIDEIKDELMDIVNFLKDPKGFSSLGARIPKGILLAGPPGTGKTLVARAVAGEANVPFYFMSGSDFVELFVGVGAARVRDLFREARANSPAIVFIDELDAVGRQRGAGLGGGHDEREQTLNALLVEMDGFDPREGIVVMAATNRPDVLDKALLRPGRFDKKIYLDVPDLKAREEIIKVHLRGKRIAPDIDVKSLARSTPGFVGADIENMVNEAALLAARENRDYITNEDFQEAVERIIVGPARKSRRISEKERKVVTYHELGHAILGYLLPYSYPVHKITIVPRGQAALGYTMQLPTEDRFLVTEPELRDKVVSLLGGRAAEEIVFNEITTGASNDLKRATELVREMVTQLGMSEKIGPIAWGEEVGEIFLGRELTRMKNFSQKTAQEIDSEIKTYVLSSYEKAKKILTDNRERMDLLAIYLYNKEEISGKEFSKMMKMSLEDLKDFVMSDEEVEVKNLTISYA